MKIETSLLRPAVQLAARLCAKRQTIPILSHLLLDGSNGALDISATDIDVYHSATVEKKSGKLPALCVPCKPLSDLIAFAGDIIEFEEAAGKLTIKSGGWVRKMSTLPAAEFHKQPDVKGMKALAVDAEALAGAVEAVAWAGDEQPQDNRFFKASVLVEMAPKSLACVATRGSVFARHEQAIICSSLTWMLPLKAAGLFAAALRGNEAKLLHDDKRVIVTHEGGFFSASLPQEKWPNYRPMLDMERISIGSAFPAEIIPALERAKTVHQDLNDAPVRIEAEGGVWTLTASARHGGDSFTEDLTPEKKNTAKRSIRVNVNYLIEALSEFEPSDMVDFGVTPENINNGGLYLTHGDRLHVVGKLVDTEVQRNHDKA